MSKKKKQLTLEEMKVPTLAFLAQQRILEAIDCLNGICKSDDVSFLERRDAHILCGQLMSMINVGEAKTRITWRLKT